MTCFNYAEITRGFGCQGERVEKDEDIRPALDRAFESGMPAGMNRKTASIRLEFHRRR